MIKKLYLFAALGLVVVGCRPRSEAGLSPDGNRVALATAKGLFVGASGQVLPTVPVVKGDVRKPEWSPDGNLVAYADVAGIRVLDVASGKTGAVGKAQFPLAWSEDSTRLACVKPMKGIATQVVEYYRAKVRGSKFAVDSPVRAYDCPFSPSGLEISSDQKRILAYDDHSLAVLSDDGIRIAKPGDVIAHASFDPNGGVLAAEIDQEVFDHLGANMHPRYRVSTLGADLKPTAEQPWQDVRQLASTDRFSLPLSFKIRPSGAQFAWVTLIDRSPEGLLANYLRRNDQINDLKKARKPVPAAWESEQKIREARMAFDIQVGVADLSGKTTYSTTLERWEPLKTEAWDSIAWSRNGRLAAVYADRTQMLDLEALGHR